MTQANDSWKLRLQLLQGGCESSASQPCWPSYAWHVLVLQVAHNSIRYLNNQAVIHFQQPAIGSTSWGEQSMFDFVLVAGTCRSKVLLMLTHNKIRCNVVVSTPNLNF